MANFTYQIDTAPLARSVDTISGHVKGTTVAVTAMEAAVIASERESARVICENVNYGFYNLIKSQISQKAVAAYTAMTSKLLILNQFSKNLNGLQNQMMSDYQMICRRYLKLFKTLDKSLENRIKELDKPVMELSKIKSDSVFGGLLNYGSLMVNAAGENTQVRGTALAARLKQKTQDAIEALAASASQTQSYNEGIESILDDSGKADNEELFLPVIYAETESFMDRHESVAAVYTGSTGSKYDKPIVDGITRFQEGMAWDTVDPEEKQKIRNEFVLLCEGADPDERINRKILELFDASSWRQTKAGGGAP